MSQRFAFASACLLLPCLAHAAPLYSLTPIDVGNPAWSHYPTSINNRGEVAGYFVDPRPGAMRRRPFAWYGAGPARELPVPAGAAHNVIRYGINDRGEVLGLVGNETAIWSPDGSMRTIAPPAC